MSGRHRWLAVALLLAAVLAYVAGLAIFLTLRATADLERGRSALEAARGQLAAGSFADAATSFSTAQSAFFEAQGALDNPFVSLTASIPFLGRTPDAIRGAAETGLLVTDAGQRLSSAVGQLRGGLEDVSLSGRQIPVEELQNFQPAVSHALELTEEAQQVADNIATTFVPASIATAGDQLRGALQQSVSALRSTDAILDALPAFAGMDRPARYFLAPQDPAELRGTGGAFSYWSILTIDEGRISIKHFDYIQELPDIRNPYWPSKELEAAYGPLNSAGDWDYSNAPADGPTTAGFIAQLWRHSGSRPVDGVIMLDVHALQSMLGATGPVQVKGIPKDLTTDNVVPFLTNGAYFLPGGLRTSRDYVGIAAIQIFHEFLTEATGYRAFRALVEATSGGHILLNATDPVLQGDLSTAGVTGALAPPEGADLFALTVNNLAGNKVDYYVQRTIHYDVTLLPAGRAHASASVVFHNDSPRDPPPKALTPVLSPGAGPNDLAAGEAYDQLTISAGSGSQLVSSSMDGARLPMKVNPVGGLQTFTATMRIPPQSSSTLAFASDLGQVWDGDGAQGAYALTIPTQPVIPKTDATVTIHAPAGMSFAAASPGVQIQGATATWHGPLTDVLTLQMRFQRNMLGRMWWDLKDAL
jgi:hypothetical protein